MASTSGELAIRSKKREKNFLVGYPAHQITGCKLPSNRQLLAALFYQLRVVKLRIREGATETIREANLFWRKARIPTKHEKDAITKLEKLYNQWRDVQKLKNRQTEKAKEKVKEFAEMLDDLFDIAHQDALTSMTCEEDRAFLLKQREKGRPGSMAGVDLKLARMEEKKEQKEIAAMNKKLQADTFDMETDEEEDESSEEEEEEDDARIAFVEDRSMDVCITSQEDLELAGPSECKKKRGVKEILTDKLSMLLDVCQLSDRNATRILTSTIEALGQNPEDFKVSRSAIQTKRKVLREKFTDKIREQVDVTDKDPIVIHWDGKLLPGVLKTEMQERVAVLISNGDKEQLLGVPVTDSSSGDEQASVVYECLQSWGISESVKAMCFDTTASNTGRFKGACTILEYMLEKELLYLACRHHIYEVELRGVFDVKLGKTTGPEPDVFKRFQKQWPTLDKEAYETGVACEDVRNNLPPELISDITSDFQSKLLQYQPRDDYKELLQLVLIFVGSMDGKVVGFRSPGPIHHARWMAKAIYCLKIFLFRSQFSLSDKEESGIRSICIFLARIYCKCWFNAPNACMAPNQDMQLLKSLIEYHSIDEEISNIGLKKFQNHLWYLSPELVALAFFDETLSDAVKLEMATKLLAESEAEDEDLPRVINPKFKRDQLDQVLNEGLPGLITKNTISFFKRFDIKTDFLKEDVSGWRNNGQYKEGLKIAKSLKVVNDVAERGVKLMTDFNTLLTRDEDQKQFVLQVVSKCRKLYPDVTKATLNRPLDIDS